MKTTREPTSDGKGYGNLVWNFDDTVDYCTPLNIKPDAAVLLRSQEETSTHKPELNNKVVIYFLEFYEFHHKILTITFIASNGDKYTVQEVSNKDGIDNYEAFRHCPPHTADAVPSPIPCKDDYEDVEEVLKRSEEFFASDSDETFVRNNFK